MGAPRIQIVDENDTPIKGATKQEAWDKGLIHRIVRIMIVDESGRILLQKRAKTVQLYPGYWDNSVAGHVDEHEDYVTAAVRELQEELGVTSVELREVDYYQTHKVNEGRTLNRFNKLFEGIIDETAPLIVDPTEVSEVKWFTPREAKKLIEDPENLVTNGLRHTLEQHYLK